MEYDLINPQTKGEDQDESVHPIQLTRPYISTSYRPSDVERTGKVLAHKVVIQPMTKPVGYAPFMSKPVEKPAVPAIDLEKRKRPTPEVIEQALAKYYESIANAEKIRKPEDDNSI